MKQPLFTKDIDKPNAFCRLLDKIHIFQNFLFNAVLSDENIDVAHNFLLDGAIPLRIFLCNDGVYPTADRILWKKATENAIRR
jgi:hypothetical protein